jgi:hypothetical protein
MQWAAGSTAIACMVAGTLIAIHHPLGGWQAMLLFLVWSMIAFSMPRAWVFAIPAVLPTLALAPWSGWLGIEELDLLVLGAAAGGYAQLSSRAGGERKAGPAMPPLAVLLLALFAVSMCISTFRGVEAAGGFAFDWYQGYREPLNSVRQAKPFLLALLVLPLWREVQRSNPVGSHELLGAGLTVGLAVASLGALWERLAFTGLLDFSTDYRTTAMFWEMHVGGAAFDGFLALTVPFTVLELQRASGRLRYVWAVTVLVLASYACLTTFSRGVYAAVPIGIAVTLWLGARQRRHGPIVAADGVWPLPAAVALFAVFAASAVWIFPSSGYRGLAALTGAVALLMRLPNTNCRIKPASWLFAVSAAAATTTLIAAAVLWIPKVAYIAYALVFSATFAMSWASVNQPSWLLAGYLVVLSSAAMVLRHWGGDAALERALPILTLLAVAGALAFAWHIKRVILPLRAQGAMLGVFLVSGGMVGVANGGAYMGDRFATSGQDLQGRVDHWREGIGMLRSPADWAFGKGLGRFPALYALEHVDTDAPGDYRLLGERGRQYLALTGGRHVIGWGELLRVSQRISAPSLPLTVRFQVRADRPVVLHLEVCEKHLLYNGGCILKELAVPESTGIWTDGHSLLEGVELNRGAWYAPRLIAFSVGNASSGTRLEVASLSLRGADHRELLDNGTFDSGLAHWFFSSDRNHMPWHLKNLQVHTLFHQGVLGLALLAALVGGALWRTAFGAARDQPFAPALAGGVMAFLIVGLFDSLLDVPRVSFMFYFLILLGLTQRSQRR